MDTEQLLLKLENIFTGPDLSDEEREDNSKVIAEWRTGLKEAKEYASWLSHPTTQSIITTAKKAYVDTAVLLATNKDLTQDKRMELFAVQSARKWFILIGSTKPEQDIKNIEQEMRMRLANEA